MNKRAVGSEKEQIAAEYLKDCGYEILECNYRCRLGEIDIVAKNGAYLVFVEVKYRKNLKMGSPLDAVNIAKQQKIRKVCQWYLMEKRFNDIPIRFDVVGILGNEITLIQNAF